MKLKHVDLMKGYKIISFEFALAEVFYRCNAV